MAERLNPPSAVSGRRSRARREGPAPGGASGGEALVVAALEVEEAELGQDDLAGRAVVAAGRALRRDRQRLVERLGHQLVELLEALLVELQRRAGEHHVWGLELAGARRRAQIADEFGDRLARELAAQTRRQRAPLALVEVRTRGGL